MYIQNNIPPSNKILEFSLRDFSGGLNNRTNLLSENQASDVRNMVFNDDNVMERVKGVTAYDATSNPAPFTYLDEYKSYSDGDYLVTCDNSTLKIGSFTQPVAGRVMGVNHLGKYFFVDGAKMYVYGKFGQTSGTFERVVGTPNPSFTVLEMVDPPSEFTPNPTNLQRGVTVYDYTNKKVWYEPCQNEVVDPYKNSNVVPKNPSYLVSFGGRLYVSGDDKADDTVYVSDVNNGYYFPSAVGLQVQPNSEKVLGLALFDDAVIVGREKSVFAISGKTNNPELGMEMFRIKRLNTHTGFANQRLVVNAHNYLFYVGHDGDVYALSSVKSDEKMLVTTLLNQSVDLYKPPFSFSESDIRSGTSYFFKDNWYVCIKDMTLLYSYRLRSWTVLDIVKARSFYALNDVLMWGDNNGKLMKFSNDYTNNGKPYASYWWSKIFDMGDGNSFKQFREFFLVAHTFDNYKSDIRVSFELDYADVNSEVVIENQMARFGISRYGDRFINRNINASEPFVIGRRARGIKFGFLCGYEITGNVNTFSDLDNVTGKVNGRSLYVVGNKDYYLYKDYNWVKLDTTDFNQPMRVYQMNGVYEFRGRR